MTALSVIVTGGTGALGRSVTSSFLTAGNRVLVPWIAKGEQAEVEGLWRDSVSSGQVRFVEADVATQAGAERVLERCSELDVLVNAAGGFSGGAPLERTELETWQALFRINVLTAVAMCRAAVPRMRARGGGVIVNIASRAALERPPGLAAYAASKDAVIVLTETLQRELADTPIRVNALVPTTIDTPANRAAMPDAAVASWTPPERIAEVVLWLASDAARSVRGGLLPV